MAQVDGGDDGGETAGFLVPASVAALLPSDLGDGGRLIPLLLAGAVEGSLLGWAQSMVLRGVLPGFPSAAWIVRTALAAAFAWLLGLLPALFWDRLQDLPPVLANGLAVAGGALLLLSIGVAQWTVLRDVVPGSGRWIGWTALAWLAGLGVFVLVSTPLWQPGQSAVVVALIGALGGLLMAVTVAAVTGSGLVRLLRDGRAPAPR